MKYEVMIAGGTTKPDPKLSVLQERGQVTIPAEIRRKLGLKKGDLVAFVETDDGVLISPRQAIAMEALDRMGGVLKEQGITLEELIASGRDIRGEIAEEKYRLEPQDD